MRIIHIENEDLVPNQKAYNCSILEHNNALLMFYRYELPCGNHNTQIGVCELDRDFQPIKSTNKWVRLNRWCARVETFDDPRAIVWRGKPTIIYPQGNVMNMPDNNWQWATSIGIAQFNRYGNMEIADKQWLPVYGKNINASSMQSSSVVACEKNWTPFVVGERLLMLYTINPMVVIEFNPLRDPDTFEIQRNKPIDLSFWKYGNFMGGGTPLLRRGNEYVGFFHTFTDDHPHKPNVRTYHYGFYAISADAPYRITRMSSKPLVTPMPDESRDLRGKSSCWRPNCVYPCGFIMRDNKVYVSQGWQDCRCEIAEFTWDEIEKDVVCVDRPAMVGAA